MPLKSPLAAPQSGLHTPPASFKWRTGWDIGVEVADCRAVHVAAGQYSG